MNQSLKLTPSQQSLVLELWQSFQGRMGKLMEVRASIHSCMQSTMPDGVFGRSFAINFLKVKPLRPLPVALASKTRKSCEEMECLPASLV